MAEETILSWNVANWVTVLIMVILGFAVLGMAAKLWQQRQQAKKTA
jgi:predicted negative regulator of RcsB-dependent stress response